MSFGQDTLSVATLIAAVAAVVAVAALGLALMLSTRLARLRRATMLLQGRGGREDFVGAVARHVESSETLREEAHALRKEVESVGASLDRAVQRVGLVRFDAFEDMGGQLSFSAALLDGHGDGLVFTTINGRSESRSYAKPVEGGASRYNLSEEEMEAIRRALAAPRR